MLLSENTETTIVPRLWPGQEPPADALHAVVLDYTDEDGNPARFCGWTVPVSGETHGMV